MSQNCGDAPAPGMHLSPCAAKFATKTTVINLKFSQPTHRASIELRIRVFRHVCVYALLPAF